ncbi:glycosyltransferase family 1 protein [Bradyrhizobium sp. CCBAU 53338]|nr:glycosyltransferase family 1 protein [Bradyrhizobium sp. CCBAU 53338]
MRATVRLARWRARVDAALRSSRRLECRARGAGSEQGQHRSSCDSAVDRLGWTTGEGIHVKPHLLCIGGEDHSFRIPFLLALRRKGFRVSAAGSAASNPFLQAGIDFHPFDFARFVDPLADWSAFRAISKLIADVRPTLVQCFDTKLNILVPFAAGGLHGVKVVSTINGRGWLYSSQSPMALSLRPIYRILERLASQWVAVTVFQNREDQAFFIRHRMIGRGGSLLIPGSGVDIATFDRAAVVGPSSAALREALGLAGREIIVTVSRMTRQKGIPTLLEAAAIVHRHRPGARFLLVGPRESEGPFAVTEAEIERHAPYVMALGRRSDVPSLLGIADLFAFPTEYHEGVPRALLEAAVAGCPIVTTTMPGCTDVVRDGWNGLLVPPGDPRRMADGILRQLDDRDAATKMAARASQRVRAEFNLDITVARYAAVYQNLVERSMKNPLPTLEEALASVARSHDVAQFGD